MSTQRQRDLRTKLQALPQKQGVWRDNLIGFLGDDLCALWGIETKPSPSGRPPDSVDVARAKAIWHLRRLTSHLNEEGAQQSAAVEFNITPHLELRGIPKIEGRVDWGRQQNPPLCLSLSTSDRHMRKTILPQFERELLAYGVNPPRPEQYELDAIIAEFQTAPVGASETISRQPTTLRHELGSASGVALVDRSEYISKLRATIDNGQKIVCLHGPPGIGKTVLAEQTAKAIGPGKVITLRTGDNAALWGDLVEALIFEGFEPTDWSDPYCRAVFKNRIAEKTNADVVVIDNVADLGSLWQLVTQSPTVPIIVTSRAPLANPAIKNIELDDFTPEQAFRFVADNIADCDAETARRLGTACGHRPLALSLAVHFLRESPAVTTADLIYEISKDIVAGLEMLIGPTYMGSSLARLYQTILNSITEDSLAVEFLDTFLAVAGTSGISEYSVAGFLMRQSAAFGSETHLHAGVRKLTSLGLVRAHDLRIIMHPLSYEVLRHLRGLPVLLSQARFIETLFDTPPEVIDSRPGRKDLLWSHKQEMIHGSNIVGGWRCLLALDENTWMAIRHREQAKVITRYEIREPNVIFELDCSTGLKRELLGIELRDLVQAMRVCHLRIVAVNLRAYTDMNNLEGIATVQRVIDGPGWWSDKERKFVVWLAKSIQLTKVGSFETIAWETLNRPKAAGD